MGEDEAQRGLSEQGDDGEEVVPVGTVIERHAVLELDLAFGAANGRAVEIEAHSSAPLVPTLRQEALSLARRTRVYVNLSCFAGEELATVTLRGRGGKAPCEVVSARILPPHPSRR